MRVHFWRRHVRNTVIILEEGNLPHPRCKNCDMLVPWRSLNGRHKDTAMCRRGAEKKRRQDTEAEIRTQDISDGIPERRSKDMPS